MILRETENTLNNSIHTASSLIVVIASLLIPPLWGNISQPSITQAEYKLYLPIVYNNIQYQVSPTNTPTATRKPKPTQTRTPTRTRVPFRSSTPRPTSTQTPTQTLTPTITLTPTSTSTITLIPFPAITIQYPSHTPSLTPTRTISPTITPSSTPSPGFISNPQLSMWVIGIFVGLLWIILAVWLYILLRRKE